MQVLILELRNFEIAKLGERECVSGLVRARDARVDFGIAELRNCGIGGARVCEWIGYGEGCGF